MLGDAHVTGIADGSPPLSKIESLRLAKKLVEVSRALHYRLVSGGFIGIRGQFWERKGTSAARLRLAGRLTSPCQGERQPGPKLIDCASSGTFTSDGLPKQASTLSPGFVKPTSLAIVLGASSKVSARSSQIGGRQRKQVTCEPGAALRTTTNDDDDR
jgi:hypothetical protein